MTGQNAAITMSVLSRIVTNYHLCYDTHSAYPLHLKQRFTPVYCQPHHLSPNTIQKQLGIFSTFLKKKENGIIADTPPCLVSEHSSSLSCL